MSNITSINANVNQESAGKALFIADQSVTECGTGIRTHDYARADHAEITLTPLGPYSSCEITEGSEGRILYLLADCIKDGFKKSGMDRTATEILADALACAAAAEYNEEGTENASEVMSIVSGALANAYDCDASTFTRARVKSGPTIFDRLKESVSAVIAEKNHRREVEYGTI